MIAGFYSRNFKLVAIASLLIFSMSVFAEGGIPSAAGSLASDVFTLPEVVLTDMRDIYLRPDNFTALSLAGASSVIMHNNGNDDKIADNFEDHKSLSEFGDRGLDFVGGPGQHFIFTGGWYILAAASEDEVNKQRAFIMLESLSVTGFTTFTLKAARNNDTPNGKPLAWPSGHTSSSFTVASVLDEFYGPWVGIPAYGVAGTVAYRMMETGDHWASDVVFGAVLGYITGHSIAGKDKELKVGCFKVLPYISPELTDDYARFGVSLACRY